jgi:hypothetical protein
MEFAPDIEVLLVGRDGVLERYRLGELLARPFAGFGGEQSEEDKP